MKHTLFSFGAAIVLLISMSLHAESDPAQLSEQGAIAALEKLKPASESLYERESFSAHQHVWKRFVKGAWPKTPEAAFEIFQTAEGKRKSAAQGPDHEFNALASLLADYARIRAKHAPLNERGLWSFVAGEAEFAFTRGGLDDYRDFLAKHTLSDDDARVAQARERIRRIQRIDEGLSR